LPEAASLSASPCCALPSRIDCRVLVVGAGPAGADLARQLAMADVDVLLVDQLADLSHAAFSSAALPLATMDRFGLPARVAAARWSQWQLIGPGERRRQWSGSGTLGVVLDFAGLRRWLAEECQAWGGRLALGLRAVACRPEGRGLRTRLRDRSGALLEVVSEWVVDATGQQRALIGEAPDGRDPLVQGLGCEWLVEVPQSLWEGWADQLAFCLGSDWVEQGYGWVFPMEPGRLKIGVCRLADGRRAQRPLAAELRSLLERLFTAQEREALRVLDRHGGLIRSRIHRREPHRRGGLLALGDAVSTANLLGGEGIRHALTSSRVLGPLLLRALDGASGSDSLGTYRADLRRALGWRWSVSGRLARRTWLGLRSPAADRRLDALLQGLEGCTADDLSALLFDYRFERYGFRAVPYLLGWR